MALSHLRVRVHEEESPEWATTPGLLLYEDAETAGAVRDEQVDT